LIYSKLCKLDIDQYNCSATTFLFARYWFESQLWFCEAAEHSTVSVTASPRRKKGDFTCRSCGRRTKINWTKTAHRTNAYTSALCRHNWRTHAFVEWLRVKHWAYWRPQLVMA